MTDDLGSCPLWHPQVLQRASAEGVATLVAYTTDFEKADALARLSRENSSVIYSMVRERHHKV